MKNRINLFKRKAQKSYISVNAPKFKRYLTILGIILFIFFGYLIVQVVQTSSTQQDLLKKKEGYLKYLLDEKDAEANVRYFKSKQSQVNTFLKNDAYFVPYYQVLKKSLEIMGGNVILDIIDIDKERETRFVVRFNNAEDMLTFLKYIESDDFLKNFASLTLQSFSLNQQQPKTKRYNLELQGVFKELAAK